eukprot:CAMPEP_0204350744 /NCGR_PEP_ID=MMETSP0469-20131031/30584_1 /ASSEMBLY_ACC=CAM_ASM_000384 /TAXON_ID=2969 /ORGANISM="Oxyrrhis marina" /LENGTH=51 /DNA_ID=CAMNT_0051337157 /DNA_START=172 /DNA_END=328 /DNA_ORIENTATION=+
MGLRATRASRRPNTGRAATNPDEGAPPTVGAMGAGAKPVGGPPAPASGGDE